MNSIVSLLRPPSKYVSGVPIVLQVIDVLVDDHYREPLDLDCCSNLNDPYFGIESNKWASCYTAYIFGVCANGESVTVRVSGFKPWFLMELSSEFENAYLQRSIRKSMGEEAASSMVSFDTLSLHRGFGWIPDDSDATKTKWFQYLKVSYATNSVRRKLLEYNHIVCDWNQRGLVVDATTDPTQQFLMHYGISPMQWITVNPTRINPRNQRYSTLDVEVETTTIRLVDPIITDIAPFLIASFDIEVNSSKGTMPEFSNEFDHITTIGVDYVRYGSPKAITRVILSIDGIREDGDEDEFKRGESDTSINISASTTILFFPTERELLLGFRDLIFRTYPTIITGFNTSGFDHYYIEGRCVYLKLSPPCIPHVICPNSNDMLRKLRREYFVLIKEDFVKKDNESIEENEVVEDHPPIPIEMNSTELRRRLRIHEKVLENLPTLSRMQFWGVLLWDKTPLYRKNLTSSALNVNILYIRKWIGTIDIDVYLMMKFFEKLASYSLESVAEHYLPEEGASKKVLKDPKWKNEMVQSFDSILGNNTSLRALFRTILSHPEGSQEAESLAQQFKVRVSDEFKNRSDLDRLTAEQACRDLGVIVGTDNYRRLFGMIKRGYRREFIEIGMYCEMDCELVLRILFKSNLILRIVKGAEVAKTLPKKFVTGGQQIRVYNQLMWFCYKAGYALNAPPKRGDLVDEEDDNNTDDDSSYEGALVIEPVTGYYEEEFIGVFDFASLYPSIIRAYNFCPSSYVTNWDALRVLPHIQTALADGSMSVLVVEGFTYIQHIKGIVPRILEELIEERSRIKRLMAECDPEQWELYNNWQMNVKIMANSVYGFFGINEKISKYPLLAVAVCTTSKGRDLITQMRTIIETEMGYSVVYGDTDSVMVKIPVREFGEVEQMFAECTRIVNILNTRLPLIIRIAFEKIYWPWLLIKKKTYAGMKYEPGKKDGKMEMKGVEPVKRNHAPFIQHTIKGLFEFIIRHKNPHRAFDYLQFCLMDLVDHKVGYLDCSLSITRNKDKPGLIAYEVAKKMNDRREMDVPGPGNRLKYVVLLDPRKVKIADRAESTAYADIHNLPVDRNYLLMQALYNGVCRIAETMGDKFPPVSPLFEAASRIIQDQDRRVQNGSSISTFFGSSSSDSIHTNLPSWDRCFDLARISKLHKKRKLNHVVEVKTSSISAFFNK